MRSRPKHLRFIATLLLSLISPLQLPGTNLGISGVIASLWQVHDESTRLLMEQF